VPIIGVPLRVIMNIDYACPTALSAIFQLYLCGHDKTISIGNIFMKEEIIMFKIYVTPRYAYCNLKQKYRVLTFRVF
jgi:hypothetical protein